MSQGPGHPAGESFFLAIGAVLLGCAVGAIALSLGAHIMSLLTR